MVYPLHYIIDDRWHFGSHSIMAIKKPRRSGALKRPWLDDVEFFTERLFMGSHVGLQEFFLGAW